MKRREFVQRVGVGSAALIAGAGAASAPVLAEDGEGGHDHRPLDGRLASATVSFGAWPVGSPDAPLDRMTTPAAPVAPNVHALLPFTTTIEAGGAVNFVIAGFHQIVVYAPPKRPQDVDPSVLLPIPGAPPEIGLIDDPDLRVYRGPDPATLPLPLSQDRVEVVQFAERGRYLVICSVSLHFDDGMYGWVRVR